MESDKPFEFIFKKFSPVEFCHIFETEKCQTRAFILSYSPNDDYIREVISQYADSEFSKAITAYLSDKKNKTAYSDFAREVSDFLENIIENNDDFMLEVAFERFKRLALALSNKIHGEEV